MPAPTTLAAAPISAPPPAPDTSFGAALERDSHRQRRGARTRAHLRIAACRLLDRGPQGDLTVAAICREAGVAHGTFYIYFPDLHALVGDVTLGFVGFAQRAMRRAARAQTQRKVRATTAAYVRLFEANPGLMKCLIHHLDTFPEARAAFQRLNRDWIGAVVRGAERDMARGGVPRAELTRRAYALGGMIDQYLAGLFLSRDAALTAVSTDREAVIDTLTLIWERGMAP